jgi:hypothetical protein
MLPLKNGGRGPALNVRLRLSSAASNYSCDVGVGTIGVDDLLDAQLTPPGIDDWSGATGTLTYNRPGRRGLRDALHGQPEG